ncbi:MAG: diguanylate cyclase [Myxococcales bacterium]
MTKARKRAAALPGRENQHPLLAGAVEDLDAYRKAGREVLEALERRGTPALQPLLLFFHSIAGTMPSLGQPDLGYLAKISEDMSRQLSEQPVLLPFVRRNFEEIERRLGLLGRQSTPPPPEVVAGLVRPENPDSPLILIVDDDPTSSRIFEHALREHDLRVRVCNQPREALAIIEALSPDLTILDVFMPGVDGFEICRSIRERSCYTYMPILFLSAADSVADRIKGISLGGDGFLMKPFEPSELVARVRGQLNRIGTLRSLSCRDPLTKVPNRGYFERRLEIEIRRSERTGGAFAVAIFDVDHFKRINDTHGHLAGDAALVQIAQSMSSQFRASDVFSRYGGEEFTLLLLDSDAAHARVRVARACDAVATAPILIGGPNAAATSVSVTVSAGLTSFRRREDDRHTLLARADSLLYAAKSGGRNRVIVDPRDGGSLP